jgi:hypothetical protein
MKILVVGDWHSHLHEEVVAVALMEIGHEVSRFAWHRYFDTAGQPRWRQYWRRAQNKYLWGAQLAQLNRDLLAQAQVMIVSRRVSSRLVAVQEGYWWRDVSISRKPRWQGSTSRPRQSAFGAYRQQPGYVLSWLIIWRWKNLRQTSF